jgi:type VI secretion system protein ImpA
LAQQILDRKPKPVEETPAEAGAGGQAPAARDGAPRGNMRTRAEVYHQLSQAAKVLRELEPHSPIPYLIERAVALGNMSFPDLIKVLVRDAGTLSELSREMGIEEPAQ